MSIQSYYDRDPSLLPIEQQTSIHHLPSELLLHLFTFIHASELINYRLVCKTWKLWIDQPKFWRQLNLKTIFPDLRFIDGKTWDTHISLSHFGLSIDDTPQIDNKKTILFIKHLLNSPLIEKGLTILLIPKGLSINKLIQIAQSPKQGKWTQLKCSQLFLKEFGGRETTKSYWVVLSNTILKNSRNQDLSSQIKLVESIGCQIPDALSITTLCLLSYFSSDGQTRLYHNHPWTLTCCAEKVGQDQLAVGAFTCDGLKADLTYTKGIPRGIAAFRKIETLKERIF